ncbi:molybdenum cofactor guanylyltransferase [Phenylobacterium kunshanense]|nr:molybdenum cofactor guanylyltransferase [Phenylobacterium kunshanense]
MNEDLAVVVLAGGEGRRMGGGKPLRVLDGATLLEHALARARGWSRSVAIAVREAGQAGDVDARLILDHPAIGGPAAGLASAFAFAREQGASRLLTVPCDAPRLPADLPIRLAAALTGDVGCAVAASLGRLHPTCALWRVEMAQRLPAYLEQRASLRGFAEACGMAVVDWDAGPEDDPFANVNTPEDLAALEAGHRAS